MGGKCILKLISNSFLIVQVKMYFNTCSDYAVFMTV